MKRFSTVFALAALAAAAVAQAQQAPPPAEPPANATSQQQSPNATTPPSDPSARANSESGKADKRALMKDCMAQVGAANPSVPEKDIKNFCDKELNQPPPPHE